MGERVTGRAGELREQGSEISMHTGMYVYLEEMMGVWDRGRDARGKGGGGMKKEGILGSDADV